MNVPPMSVNFPDIKELVRPQAINRPIEQLMLYAADKIGDQVEAVIRHFSIRAADEPELLPMAEQCLAAALRLREIPIAKKQKIYLHPSFNYWLRGMRRRSIEPIKKIAELAQHIADFVWPEEIAEGKLSFPWQTQLDDRGGLRCISFGRFIEFGAGREGQNITLTGEGDYLVVSFEDSMVVKIPREDILGRVINPPPTLKKNGYWVNILPTLLPGGVECSSRESALRVDFTWTHQRTTGVNFFGISDALFPGRIKPDKYAESLNLIKEAWPSASAEFPYITRVIVPMDSGPEHTLAFTVSSRQGAIFIDEMAPESMVENLLHENAHVKLRLIQLFDPLLEDWQDETQKFPVPWRKDLRPLPGIFEGIFVFSHIAEWTKRLSKQKNIDLNEKTENLLRDVGYGISLIKENGKLTETGASFLNEVENWNASLVN